MEYVSGSTIYKNMTILKFLLQLCWNAHLLSTHLKFIIFTQKRFLSQCAGAFISTLRPVSTLLPFCLNGSHVLLSQLMKYYLPPWNKKQSKHKGNAPSFTPNYGIVAINLQG